MSIGTGRKWRLKTVRTVYESKNSKRNWRRLSPLALILPLGLFGCATTVPVPPPKPKPMPELLQKVEPRDDLCRMQQILGERCSSSEPIF